jgi:hypothetical protein
MRKHLQLQILCFTFATAESLEKNPQNKTITQYT